MFPQGNQNKDIITWLNQGQGSGSLTEAFFFFTSDPYTSESNQNSVFQHVIALAVFCFAKLERLPVWHRVSACNNTSRNLSLPDSAGITAAASQCDIWEVATYTCSQDVQSLFYIEFWVDKRNLSWLWDLSFVHSINTVCLSDKEVLRLSSFVFYTSVFHFSCIFTQEHGLNLRKTLIYIKFRVGTISTDHHVLKFACASAHGYMDACTDFLCFIFSPSAWTTAASSTH